VREIDRLEFREKFGNVDFLDLYDSDVNYHSHQCTLKEFLSILAMKKKINSYYFGSTTGKLLQYFASQIVRSVYRLHEKGYGHS
jgi:hypothetical protein